MKLSYKRLMLGGRRTFTMKLGSICVLVFLSSSCWSSEFVLEGDYSIGGLFPLYGADPNAPPPSPGASQCSRNNFWLSGYQMLQVMRFAVEEINNSSALLPGVSLGYRIFTQCSDTHNFPSVFSFISRNGSIRPSEDMDKHHPEVLAVVGPYGSTDTITLAPLFTMYLVPMVNYGASSYTLSDKLKYPSFLRSVPSNKDLIQMIVRIIQWFGWNWIAFLTGRDDYSADGLDLLNSFIGDDGSVCLAYQETLAPDGNYSHTLRKIDALNINVIVIFAVTQYASAIIRTAVTDNLRNKVWIASETWSMDPQIAAQPGIEKIGTVIGITERFQSLPGFLEFLGRSRGAASDHTGQCNQQCEQCERCSADQIASQSPTFSFAIYAAVYSVAHALHAVLHCGRDTCTTNSTLKPHALLAELKRVDFSLRGRQVKYDEKGDLSISYVVVLWRTSSGPPRFQVVGTYETYPRTSLTIQRSLLPWSHNGSFPFSNCSVECKAGFARQPEGLHSCCFTCIRCPRNSAVDPSRDPYTCSPCQEGEWSDEGSTACQQRTLVYLQLSEAPSVLLVCCSACLICVLIAVTCLFAWHRETPVVRSAGGTMCFLMLFCLLASSLSVFFFFGKPSVIRCLLRNVVFAFFFAVCLSCLTVRSFQIVCVFKMAARFPAAHRIWVKLHGQWLFVSLSSVLHLSACIIWTSVTPDVPVADSWSFRDQTMLICECSNTMVMGVVVFWSWFLGFVCLVFSYMGRDLPKNYNEAKSITFSLLLYNLSWIVFYTAYLSVRSNYITLLNAAAQISSVSAILCSYFLPKSFIILFQPEKNTPAYFQNSIQNYTQTISRT